MQLYIYILIHHIIFWLYFYFLNILYFFKYSCTNIFHRHSLCTFYYDNDNDINNNSYDDDDYYDDDDVDDDDDDDKICRYINWSWSVFVQTVEAGSLSPRESVQFFVLLNTGPGIGNKTC